MVVSLRAIFRGATPGQWHENQKRSKIININTSKFFLENIYEEIFYSYASIGLLAGAEC